MKTDTVNATRREISWPLDDTTIDATLVRPTNPGPFPGVVMAAGSGPTDRDWNSPLLPGANGSASLLADALAMAGFASLRYDKRASGPRAMANVPLLAGKISMESHRQEFEGAVRILAEQQDIDSSHIFALANSEGTLHALNYQNLSPPVPLAGLVLIGPPGRTVAEVARAQIAALVATMPDGASLMALYDDAISDFVAGSSVSPDPGLPEVAQSLIRGLAAPINQPFSRELWTTSAADLLRKINVPILAVIGKKDVQVDWQADGALLQNASRTMNNVSFFFPENADHVLKYEPRQRGELTGADAVGYNAADRHLDPGALGFVLEWLTARTKP
jgi:pimeloyl-ACP methyl ester carboxylesterase